MYNFEKFIKGFQISNDGIWAYPSKAEQYSLDAYGFKIHISASIYNAYYILSCTKKILEENHLMYKVISSVENLNKLNSGELGYSQIGKFVTVYPPDDEILKETLELLYKATLGFYSIDIPSDFRYKNSHVVFYRYGELKKVNQENVDQRIREIPEQICVPIADYYLPRYKVFPNCYTLLFCMRARGKTRVFQGLSIKTKKLVIVKEGIMLGEIDKNGNDGVTGVLNEKEILFALKESRFFPELYDFFYVGNSFFIVEEYRKGHTISQLLEDGKNEIVDKYKIKIIEQIIDVLMELYEKNIIIGDLSFDNILLDEGKISLIDVEYYSFKTNYIDFQRGTWGFWCKEFSGEKLVLYMFISLWYHLYHLREYMENKKKEFKFKCEIEKYIAFNNNFSCVLEIDNYKEALEFLFRIFKKENEKGD